MERGKFHLAPRIQRRLVRAKPAVSRRRHLQLTIYTLITAKGIPTPAVLFPFFQSPSSPMAIVENLRSFSLHRTAKKSRKLSFVPFEDKLHLGLKLLLPIPEPSEPLPTSWLSKSIDLLALTLNDAAAVFSDPSISPSDQSAIAAYLDSSIRLLDACNSISSATGSIISRRLLLHLAVRHLSTSGEKNVTRARALLSDWEIYAVPSAAHRLMIQIHHPPPRGAMSAVHRVIYAVDSLSYLVIAALEMVVGGGENGGTEKLAVSGEFMWSSAFNDVGAGISIRFGAGLSGEVAEVRASVRNLAAAMDEAEHGDDGERLRTAVLVLERAEEKLTARLCCLSNAVNGLFGSALSARDAALQSFRVRRLSASKIKLKREMLLCRI